MVLASAGAASAYGWPVKPFDKQHPIRGFFGDPRTVYDEGSFDGPGVFSFHQGVDIVAPNGTPVYPVASGRAHYLGAATLNVDSGMYEGNRRIFQYFHIVPVVGEGQHVVARRTVLGYVQAPYGHVHLTEIDGAEAVNPLQRGHLTPYADRTRPTIRSASFANLSGVLQAPHGLCGRVQIEADAFDTTPLPVPGAFNGLPVTPAFIRWQITHANGAAAVRWRVAADFRHTLPRPRDFFAVYAKGTYENSPRFGAKQYTSLPGRYLFLLAARFDTASLANGRYTLTIQAQDVRGNQARFHKRFSVLNAKGSVCPDTLAAAPSSESPPVEPPSSAGP
jgi:hypothetical protein